jgi:uncharacterized membrane protein
MGIVDGLVFSIALVAALGCGLMAGLFFAFSVSVMRALARLPSAEGIAAMQSINVAIINPVFLAAFFGTAAACVLVIIAALLRWHDQGAVYLFIGPLSRRHFLRDYGVQCAEEQSAGIGRARQCRECQRMD